MTGVIVVGNGVVCGFTRRDVYGNIIALEARQFIFIPIRLVQQRHRIVMRHWVEMCAFSL